MNPCSFDITWNANHVISKLKWKTTILNGTPPKKLYIWSTHNLDSTGHVISILHDGQSCNIDTTYQPILAVTDLPAFFWRDNFFHYLLTTERLYSGEVNETETGFRFHFPQRKPVSVSFPVETVITGRLLLRGGKWKPETETGFRFGFPQRKPVSVSIFPVETVTH